ncbi:MAG: 50S ribosomal protein L22 [Chitinophagales bacterium]|nr:50S ribosomal protein L22 [Chitinophagales bacterium]
MGARKQIAAKARKEQKSTQCSAKAVGVPTSPRKMRLVADAIRGKDVMQALNILTFSTKHASNTMEKLLRSAIANWENKFEMAADESELFVKEVFVDGGRTLKRFLPAPMGRAYRIRKRSNHVTIVLDSRNQQLATEVVEEEQIENNEN